MYSDTSLMSPGFRPDAYLSHALNLPSTDGESARLGRCIESIHGQQRDLIGANHDSMVNQLDSLRRVDGEVSRMQSCVRTLESSASRLQHTIEKPFSYINNRVARLQNVQSAIEIVRAVQRFLVLHQRIQELQEVEPSRAARTLKEIEDLLSTTDLAGVAVVDKRLDDISKCSAKIRMKAHELLKAGLTSQKQSDVGAALQCFFSLDCLARVVQGKVADYRREALKTIVTDLDPSTVTKELANIGRQSEGTKTREIIFGRLDTVFNEITVKLNSIGTIWKVLLKKRDPVTQEPLISALTAEQEEGFCELWTQIGSALREKLQRLVSLQNLSVMFCAEFPAYFGRMKSLSLTVSEYLSLSPRRNGVAEATKWFQESTDDLKQRYVGEFSDRIREKFGSFLSRVSHSSATSSNQELALDQSSTWEVPPFDVRVAIKAVHHELTTNQHEEHLLTHLLTPVVQQLADLHTKLAAFTKRSENSDTLTNKHLFDIGVANAAVVLTTEIDCLVALLPRRGIEDRLDELREVPKRFSVIASTVASRVAASLGSMLCVATTSGKSVPNSVPAAIRRLCGMFDRRCANLDSELRSTANRVQDLTVLRCIFWHSEGKLDEIAASLDAADSVMDGFQIGDRRVVAVKPLSRIRAALLSSGPLPEEGSTRDNVLVVLAARVHGVDLGFLPGAQEKYCGVPRQVVDATPAFWEACAASLGSAMSANGDIEKYTAICQKHI